MLYLQSNNPFGIQICIFEKIIALSATEIDQIKQNKIMNGNSCKVPISCTIYIIYLKSATPKWKTKISYVTSDCFKK